MFGCRHHGFESRLCTTFFLFLKISKKVQLQLVDHSCSWKLIETVCWKTHQVQYSVSFTEFFEESFETGLGLSVPVANNENSFLLFLGWKGMTLKFKNVITKKSIKSYVPLSIYFLQTLIVKILKLLCLCVTYTESFSLCRKFSLCRLIFIVCVSYCNRKFQ